MLILTRRPGQILHIGDDITLTVLSISGESVRVGIEAPRSVQVLREEAKCKQPKDYAETGGNY